ncbi:hypothetical protein [Microcoleus sp. D2_18a_D3]|uniref:hypothetical protein n=1 Tax=Microcoleus sp. D2_18a_D3 TaxID=3055330 RepID=UPI002FD28625
MTRATEPTFNGPAGSTKTIRMLASAVSSIFIWEEGRRKKEEGRRKKEEGRRKKEEGRRKRQ